MLKIYCYRVVFIASRIIHALTSSIANLTLRAIVFTVTIAIFAFIWNAAFVAVRSDVTSFSSCRDESITSAARARRARWLWLLAFTPRHPYTVARALVGVVFGLIDRWKWGRLAVFSHEKTRTILLAL